MLAAMHGSLWESRRRHIVPVHFLFGAVVDATRLDTRRGQPNTQTMPDESLNGGLSGWILGMQAHLDTVVAANLHDVKHQLQVGVAPSRV